MIKIFLDRTGGDKIRVTNFVTTRASAFKFYYKYKKETKSYHVQLLSNSKNIFDYGSILFPDWIINMGSITVHIMV